MADEGAPPADQLENVEETRREPIPVKKTSTGRVRTIIMSLQF